MRVGSIDIEVPVLLAPMAAVTDLPFRTVCEELGAGFTITEFLSAHALSHGDPKAIGKMTPSMDGRRFGVQIFGREVPPMQTAARLAVSIGASLVDINMGCPAKRVVAGACGSALMKEPVLAQELVRAVVAAVPAHVPVTVKHRAGWDDGHQNAPEFACALVEAGARMITVHGRTRTQGFSGRASLAAIAAVRAAVPASVPVIGNGDVIDVAGYRRMKAETGCDGVMIGRGAMGNPWLFRRLGELERGRPDPGEPSAAERLAIFERHVSLLRQLRPGPKLYHELRKAGVWYAKGLPGANALRIALFELREEAAVVARAGEFFHDHAARATRLAA